ncbi:hypothetical protein C8Q79DRAFT_705791 [Trametes meyenii]|nr:hypothetical protein C8Q79DRAFT_705791 [Trametes meyenii]
MHGGDAACALAQIAGGGRHALEPRTRQVQGVDREADINLAMHDMALPSWEFCVKGHAQIEY